MSEASDVVVEYLKGELEKLRAELAQAEADFQDAARRQRERVQHITALEGVLSMLEPSGHPAGKSG